MDRQLLKWHWQWAVYLFWWAGYWIALFVLSLICIGSILSKHIDTWVSVALAALVATCALLWPRVVKARGARTRRSEKERWHDPIADDEWGASGLIGLFCGSFIMLLLSAGIARVLERLGHHPPEGTAGSIPMLFGAWLGACTWQGLGGSQSRKATRAIYLAGGWIALVGVVGVIAWQVVDRLQPNWTKSALVLIAFYSPVILWSVIMAVAGIRTETTTCRPSPAPEADWLPDLRQLISAHTMTFVVEVSIGQTRDEGDEATVVKLNRRKVWAARPDSLRIELTTDYDPDQRTHPDPLDPCDLFVTDGIRQCEVFRETGEYEESEALGSIDMAVSLHGMTSMIHAHILFADDPLAGFIPVDKTTIEDEPVWVFEAGQERFGYRMYVSVRTELPTRISIYSRTDFGPEIETLRADYRDWWLNGEIDLDLFDPTPPEGMNPRSI